MNLQVFSNLSSFLKQAPLNINGVFVDTSILFAATYGLDHYNEAADEVFENISRFNMSVYANVNVKYEFLEHHRQVILADAICDFLDIYASQLSGPIKQKLLSFKTLHKRKVDSDESSKLNSERQKIFSKLLQMEKIGKRDSWDVLCKEFLYPQLTPLWDETVDELEIVEIKTRNTDETSIVHQEPIWKNVTELMGKYGIASADAMIINMFFVSKISVLLTADTQMARTIILENKPNKKVFIPDELLPTLKQLL